MEKTFTRLTFLIVLLFLASFATLPALAQAPAGKVSGSVGETGGKLIESASVTLLRAGDSTRIRTIAADKAGRYSFDRVESGKYLILASAVGHIPVYSQGFALTA